MVQKTLLSIFSIIFILNIGKISCNDIEPIKILLEVEEKNIDLILILKKIVKTLNSTGQFLTKINYKNNFEKNKNKLLNSNFTLVIKFDYCNENKNNLEIKIYDIQDLLCLKKLSIKYNKQIDTQDLAYKIADQLWKILMNEESSFACKIAYLKHLNSGETAICIADYNGKREKEIYKSKNKYIGLYWNKNKNNLRLFCSEFTPYNVRLISIYKDHNSDQYKKNTLWDFYGTSVGISFLNNNDNETIYCRSGDIWYYEYLTNLKIAKHKKLISNDGKNIYPIFLENKDIIFCSDSINLAKKFNVWHGPKIYYFNFKDGSINIITKKGYCISPAYDPIKKILAYSRRIDKYFQLFIYDFNTKKHKQITYGKGNKIDPSWYPCSNKIAFCYKINKISRIACIDLNLNKKYFLTNKNNYCDSIACSSFK